MNRHFLISIFCFVASVCISGLVNFCLWAMFLMDMKFKVNYQIPAFNVFPHSYFFSFQEEQVEDQGGENNLGTWPP